VTDAPETRPAPAKVDPETLVLRAAPMRVTRFRRGVIILASGIAATAITGGAWLALKPAGIGLVASEDEREPVVAKGPADALAGAPSSYGDVPQLGPPLPGDLGKPILDHQREMGMASVDPIADPAAEAAARAAQEAEAERQRLLAERKAARESGVMLQIAGRAYAAPAASEAARSAPEDASQSATPTAATESGD
jgi:type IV secretion system protein VirB10